MFIEDRRLVRKLGSLDLADPRAQVLTRAKAAETGLAEPSLAEHRGANRHRERDEAMVGADVGSRFVPADVLLAGGEGEHVSGCAIGVEGAPHEPAWHLPDEGSGRSEEAYTRATVLRRNRQRLTLAHADVDSDRARRLEHRECVGFGGCGDHEGVVRVGHAPGGVEVFDAP